MSLFNSTYLYIKFIENTYFRISMVKNNYYFMTIGVFNHNILW